MQSTPLSRWPKGCLRQQTPCKCWRRQLLQFYELVALMSLQMLTRTRQEVCRISRRDTHVEFVADHLGCHGKLVRKIRVCRLESAENFGGSAGRCGVVIVRVSDYETIIRRIGGHGRKNPKTRSQSLSSTKFAVVQTRGTGADNIAEELLDRVRKGGS